MIPLADGDLRHQRGFTLMELLVALTLLGMLMAALFGGVRLGARVWEASDQRHETQGQMQAARRFLQERFEQIQPLALGDGRSGVRPVFVGERDRLTLASSMPASLGPGTFLLEIELQKRNGDERRDLLVRWRPLTAATIADAADQGGERVLIEDVDDMSVAYFGARDDASGRGWYDRWRDDVFLPELIRLELRFPAGDRRNWKPLAVSPMIDEWYDSGS